MQTQIASVNRVALVSIVLEQSRFLQPTVLKDVPVNVQVGVSVSTANAAAPTGGQATDAITFRISVHSDVPVMEHAIPTVNAAVCDRFLEYHVKSTPEMTATRTATDWECVSRMFFGPPSKASASVITAQMPLDQPVIDLHPNFLSNNCSKLVLRTVVVTASVSGASAIAMENFRESVAILLDLIARKIVLEKACAFPEFAVAFVVELESIVLLTLRFVQMIVLCMEYVSRDCAIATTHSLVQIATPLVEIQNVLDTVLAFTEFANVRKDGREMTAGWWIHVLTIVMERGCANLEPVIAMKAGEAKIVRFLVATSTPIHRFALTLH